MLKSLSWITKTSIWPSSSDESKEGRGNSEVDGLEVFQSGSFTNCFFGFPFTESSESIILTFYSTRGLHNILDYNKKQHMMTAEFRNGTGMYVYICIY